MFYPLYSPKRNGNTDNYWYKCLQCLQTLMSRHKILCMYLYLSECLTQIKYPPTCHPRKSKRVAEINASLCVEWIKNVGYSLMQSTGVSGLLACSIHGNKNWRTSLHRCQSQWFPRFDLWGLFTNAVNTLIGCQGNSGWPLYWRGLSVSLQNPPNQYTARL